MAGLGAACSDPGSITSGAGVSAPLVWNAEAGAMVAEVVQGTAVPTRITIRVSAAAGAAAEVTQRIVNSGGEVVHVRAFGRRVVERGELVLFDTVRIAAPGLYRVEAAVAAPDGGAVHAVTRDTLGFSVVAPDEDLSYARRADPASTVVTNARGEWRATLTDGAYTVTLPGPARVFQEPEHTAARVEHGIWVRTLPRPFDGKVDPRWLRRALADTTRPDVLALGMQYASGAPDRYAASGLRIAGDADYGLLLPGGNRQEGADFNDYLGVPWSYAAGVDSPESGQWNSLDCSGLVRMIFGYRSGVPLVLSPDGRAIPRRAYMMYESAPGVITHRDEGVRPADLSGLAVGDLVFFDASDDDGPMLDHVGIFLGLDSDSKHRFLSSRKQANGPTMGDTGGRSVLDLVNGTGTYARAFRAVRRL